MTPTFFGTLDNSNALYRTSLCTTVYDASPRAAVCAGGARGLAQEGLRRRWDVAAVVAVVRLQRRRLRTRYIRVDSRSGPTFLSMGPRE